MESVSNKIVLKKEGDLDYTSYEVLFFCIICSIFNALRILKIIFMRKKVKVSFDLIQAKEDDVRVVFGLF